MLREQQKDEFCLETLDEIVEKGERGWFLVNPESGILELRFKDSPAYVVVVPLTLQVRFRKWIIIRQFQVPSVAAICI